MVLELKDRQADATMAYAQALKVESDCEHARNRLAQMWSSEIRRFQEPKEPTIRPLSAYDEDRRHVDITFEENEREQSRAMLKEYPAQAKDLSSVALPEDAKRYIDRVTKIIKNPNLAEECGLRRPYGVILEGPNGTGKTELAHALSGELDWNIVTASFGSFASKWLGQTENNLVKIFDTLKAEGLLPAVVLFDEIDSIARSKDGESRAYECTIVNTLITEINRLASDAGLKEVFIVGTTNHINLIDPAIIRSGRLDRVAMPLPTLEAREQIFRIHFRGKPVAKDVDFSLLAYRTEGRSGADIAAYANEAAFKLFEARLADRKVREITMGMMEDIISHQSSAPKRLSGYA
jgi:SpoVK/Ycf46/Vps4 family AAA+-type ATPase